MGGHEIDEALFKQVFVKRHVVGVALQGHAIAGMSGRYGEFPARVTSKGIAKLPRIDIEKLPDASNGDLIA